MDTIEAQILEAVREEFGGNPLAEDSLTGLGIDSLRMAELGSDLERKFHIRVDEEILEVETVRDLADYVRARMPD